ncbi:MAG: porphobilinogen synthase [Candidatus Hydrogenedentes bacterium]|nr:porphobilinogen synthase [Candidatus Hydrogenedentota bacterium]
MKRCPEYSPTPTRPAPPGGEGLAGDRIVEPLTYRPRRNRRNPAIRSLVRENVLQASDFYWPVFVTDGEEQHIPIASMPGVFRLSVDELIKDAREAHALGINALALFPVIAEVLKDPVATESKNPHGLLPTAIRALKEALPDLLIVTDVAMDPYSSDGHDGVVSNGQIINDETLPILADMAVAQADAGADIVAPSDMMDGRIGYIREALDNAGYSNVGILAYSAKYASAFYGPFRDALDSAPKHGDKKTYQMDPCNAREALLEVALDVAEGADMIMVKPGMPYLDVIYAVRENTDLPVAAYQVSGEYAMIQAAAQNGWLDKDKCMMESLMAFKRAGADMILTYFAVEAARKLKEGWVW